MKKQRGQFTFYRSFYNASTVMSRKDALAFLVALIEYSLDGEIKSVELPPMANAAFTLVRPNLDTARRKAEAGALGGKATKANSKQSEE